MTDETDRLEAFALKCMNASTRLKFWILGSEHQPIEVDMMTWAEWFGDIENRRVAVDFGPGWRLSSVCMGHELGWDSDVPILFETMLFREDPNAPDNTEMDRFATWDECKAAHDAWVARLRKEENDT